MTKGKTKAVAAVGSPAMTVYACGGTGINIAKRITDLDTNIFYIDGSDANFDGVPSENLFQIPGMKGAGKRRETTNEMMKEGVEEDIVIKFRPSETLNVLLFSAAGGSGSVIGIRLLRQLLVKNLPVVVTVVDSRTSHREICNSLATFTNLQKVSRATKKSVSCFYVRNTSRKEGDQQAVQFINLMSVLTDSRKVDEADPEDLFNFLNFDLVTDNKPTTAMIDIGTNEPVSPKSGEAIVATMLVSSDRNVVIQPCEPEYLSTVIIKDKDYSLGDIRIDNVVGRLSSLISEFEALDENMTNNKKVNKVNEVDVDVDDEDDFMVI